MVSRISLSLTLVLASTLAGCGSVDESPSDSQQLLIRSLTRSCIEANGGARMDAVGLYGGSLMVACSQWAHRRARQAVSYPP